MFISPKKAIEKGWITHPSYVTVDDFMASKLLSPNALDFTLDSVRGVSGGPAILSEDQKVMRGHYNVPITEHGWRLDAGQVYDITSKIYVNLPEGVAAILFTRSTLVRNGVFLMSGLWDSGFCGNIGCTLYPIGGDITIAPGTRVGQIALVTSEFAGMYAGGYNTSAGQHWADSQLTH